MSSKKKYNSIIRTVTHEILHTFNVGQCSEYCIMKSAGEEVSKELTLCEVCQKTVNDNKLWLYNH